MRKLATSRATSLGWLFLAALLLSAAPTLAVAGGNQPKLDWRAPEGCPDAATFAAQVARYLGSSSAGAKVRVVVEVGRDEDGFHLVWRMQTPEGEGERHLDGDDCGLLAETAALTIALAIDPNAEEGIDEAAIFAAEDDEQPPESLEAVVPFAEIRRPRRRPPVLRIAARVTVGGDIGSLPGFGPSLGGSLAAQSGRIRLEGSFTRWFERHHKVADPPGTGGDFHMMTGAGRVCGDIVRRFGTWSACLGGEGGKIYGSGFGVDVPESNSSSWFAATGALAGSWKLANHLFFRADLQLVVPKDRPRFVLSGVLVHQPGIVNARLVTGLELQFN